MLVVQCYMYTLNRCNYHYLPVTSSAINSFPLSCLGKCHQDLMALILIIDKHVLYYLEAYYNQIPITVMLKALTSTQWYKDANTPTVYHKKYAHGFCFAVLCCGYTLTDFSTSIRLTSLALWQSNDCPSASKATLMNMDKYFMWIHNERLHHNKAKHNKTVCIFLGIYCTCIVHVTAR